MHPAGESFLFEQEQRYRSAARERARKHSYLMTPRRPHLLTRIHKFFQVLNHVRRIRIEVTFDYQESRPKTAGG